MTTSTLPNCGTRVYVTAGRLRGYGVVTDTCAKWMWVRVALDSGHRETVRAEEVVVVEEEGP